MYDGERGIALEPMQGSRASSLVDLGYTKLFHIPAVTSVSLSTCEGFWGTLWSSVKQIKASYVYDWQHGTVMQAMQGNRDSSRVEMVVSWVFSS